MYEVIDRKSKIDGMSAAGQKPSTLKGLVQLNNVSFAYPSAPDVPVLADFSASIQPGKVLALVGHSGCGKSTIINLFERFHAPTGGQIMLDGVLIQDYNIQWLRQHIGLVTQQPALLPDTIFANIAFGKPNATKREVIDAAKQANAHDFIMGFPAQYDTPVGDLGSQLSGGQRQRIAIARTLISNPRILLLDEATSALDNKSEKVVQDALDRAAASRTTIIIAHRLSTVRNADEIVVMDHGKIVERGTHETLVAAGKTYAAMVQQQESKDTDGSASAADQADADADNSVEETSVVAAKVDTAQSGGEAGATEQNAPLKGFKKQANGFAWGVNRPDIHHTALSIFGGVLAGLVWPLNCIVMAELLALAQVGGEPKNEVNTWVYMCVK